MELYLCVNLCFVLFDIYIHAVSLEDLKFETIAFTRNPNEYFLGEKKGILNQAQPKWVAHFWAQVHNTGHSECFGCHQFVSRHYEFLSEDRNKRAWICGLKLPNRSPAKKKKKIK